MDLFFLLVVLLLGLSAGSYINMLVYRTAVRYKTLDPKFKFPKKKHMSSRRNEMTVAIPLGLSRRKISRNGRNIRSFCDGCGRQLSWYENIPVLSWVLQKGRSRCCDSPLLWSYPVVELMMGMLFVGWFLIWNETRHASLLHLLLGFVVIVFLLFGLIMDLKYMVLPDFGTVILCVSALVFWYVGGKNDFWNYFLSGIGSFGFLLLLHLVTKGNGMGMGDVKLAFFMGTFLGFKGVVMAFYIAFVFGAVVGVILLLLKKAKRKTVIAFGPFLIIGTLLSWWWGEKIILIFNSQFLINF